jgi:hypothetical protein
MASFHCARCGHRGASESVLGDFAVCPECGAPARSSTPPLVFRGAVYRYGARIAGLGPLARKLGSPIVRDGDGRAIARVEPRRAPVRRTIAVGLGAAAFVVSSVALGAALPIEGAVGFAARVLGVLVLLGLSLALVTALSPAPDLLLVAAGPDPTLLLRVRPTRHGFARTTLVVEDGEGAELGSMELDRLRNVVLPLSLLGPVATVQSREGPRVVARRAGLAPSMTLVTDDGTVLGRLGPGAGLVSADELRLDVEPCPVDPRLLVAALVLLRA